MRTFYENEQTGTCIFEQDRELYKIQSGETTKLNFREFIREIDIKPEVEPQVKRETILDAARIVGMFV